MIQMIYRSPNGRITFQTQVESARQAFEALARIQGVFEEECCGLCGSKGIHCQVRTTSGGDYYEWVCADCGATLTVGQNKDGKRLFIRRTDEDRNPLPNGGWFVWQPNTEGKR